jgi:hypothetical protein
MRVECISLIFDSIKPGMLEYITIHIQRFLRMQKQMHNDFKW